MSEDNDPRPKRIFIPAEGTGNLRVFDADSMIPFSLELVEHKGRKGYLLKNTDFNPRSPMKKADVRFVD